MTTETHCGANLFTALEPDKQAEYLTLLAHDARLLQCSLEAADITTQQVGDRLQRALAHAMDADNDDDSNGARNELESVLVGARAAGMRLSAEIGEVDVDGLLGTMKMRVLSTVLAPALGFAA